MLHKIGDSKPSFKSTDVKQVTYTTEKVDWQIHADKDVFIGDNGGTSSPSGNIPSGNSNYYVVE